MKPLVDRTNVHYLGRGRQALQRCRVGEIRENESRVRCTILGCARAQLGDLVVLVRQQVTVLLDLNPTEQIALAVLCGGEPPEILLTEGDF